MILDSIKPRLSDAFVTADPDVMVDAFRTNARIVVERGSVVYGTVNMNSDRDRLYVIPDDYKMVLLPFEKHIWEYHFMSGDGVDVDDQFICESDFQKLLDDCDVMAVETVFTPADNLLRLNNEKLKVRVILPFDKWKIRQSFSGTASNSWAKAHKKMTVEKDLDMYRGAKSLFHSLRILMFANQICERGVIDNFEEATPLWWEIYGEYLDGQQWPYFKEKYKPVYNSLRSKLAVLAPKPIE